MTACEELTENKYLQRGTKMLVTREDVNSGRYELHKDLDKFIKAHDGEWEALLMRAVQAELSASEEILDLLNN